MKPLTAEELAELRKWLAAAQKTDEHLCPDDLIEPVSRLLDEVERSRAAGVIPALRKIEFFLVPRPGQQPPPTVREGAAIATVRSLLAALLPLDRESSPK